MKFMNIARMTLVGVSATAMLLAPAMVGAAADPNDLFGLPSATDAGLTNQDLTVTVSKLIKVALSLLGIVALVIVLMGGFKWMTAGGSDEKVKEAKKLIFQGIIGLAIVLSAFSITSFVLSGLKEAVTAGP